MDVSKKAIDKRKKNRFFSPVETEMNEKSTFSMEIVFVCLRHHASLMDLRNLLNRVNISCALLSICYGFETNRRLKGFKRIKTK